VRKIDHTMDRHPPRAMRGVRTIVALGLSLLMASCNTVEERLIEQGIGTELAADDIVESTRKLNEYLFYLCGQAGLASTAIVDGVTSPVACGTNGSTGWMPIVKAGFNDIDRRCDTYLAWLNSRRRNETAILNEIHDMRTFTEALLFTTGVSAAPITIAGLAFGLASNTFTNYYSRLLFEVEKSTVGVVVREKRLEYRAKFNIVITNQPDAVHLLREYLLICTPFYIEDVINQRTRDSVAGNIPVDVDDAERIRKSIVAGALLGGIPPEGPRGKLPGVGGTPPGVPREPKMTGGSEFENSIPQSMGKVIQANLCVQPVKTSFDTPLRDAIQQAKLGGNQSGPSAMPFSNIKSEIVSRAEVQTLIGAGPCNVDKAGTDRGYRTAFEKFAFPEANAITSLQRALIKCSPKLAESGLFDPDTRGAIKVAKAKTNLAEPEKSSDTLNSGSFDAVSKAIRTFCK
jgi:hypothetical protein